MDNMVVPCFFDSPLWCRAIYRAVVRWRHGGRAGAASARPAPARPRRNPKWPRNDRIVAHRCFRRAVVRADRLWYGRQLTLTASHVTGRCLFTHGQCLLQFRGLSSITMS